ncbi:Threonine efflux protein [Candidatus Rhodobacter oscarellae]|uniref:Threonine efflux protein n=1 Tax=Candidatus Rhodobacter oscarellae TaxID=1675527 RepID=A0A0J9E2X1_9RHOB|nr:LysE family translocator [Candidatus Rhodobacter lobularis]KMW57080.1 Threonine efflux protein [Candidatus Rhodobacter lobularis]
MSPEIYSLFLALGIFAVGFISIGPNILAIIGTSMQRGRRDGVQLALGVGLGSGLWAAMTVLGLTALITAYAGIVTILKVFGACYLAWLAWKSFRAAVAPRDQITARAATGQNLLLKGIAIQMTNPKSALQWIAIVGLGLGAEAPLWLGATLVVSAMALSVVGHLAYAITFSTSPVIAFYNRFRRWLEAGLGVFFSFAAYKVATYRA